MLVPVSVRRVITFEEMQNARMSPHAYRTEKIQELRCELEEAGLRFGGLVGGLEMRRLWDPVTQDEEVQVRGLVDTMASETLGVRRERASRDR